MTDFDKALAEGLARSKQYEACMARVSADEQRLHQIVRTHPLAAEHILGVEINRNADGSLKLFANGEPEGWGGAYDSGLARAIGYYASNRRLQCGRN